MLDFMGLGPVNEVSEEAPWQTNPEGWAESFNETAEIAVAACSCSVSKDPVRLRRTREFCVLGNRVIPKRDHYARDPEYDKDGYPIRPGHPVLRAYRHIMLELVEV